MAFTFPIFFNLSDNIRYHHLMGLFIKFC